MKLAVVATGSEVTEGRIINSNAALISKRLRDLGFTTTLHAAAPDEPEAIARALVAACDAADLVIVSGGLGPTVDDLTRDVAAKVAGDLPLEEDAAALAWLEAIFARFGRRMSDNNRRQAIFPRGATVVPNRFGTAAGFRLPIRGKECIFLPGVPHELEGMLGEEVLPYVARTYPAAEAVRARRLDCFGLPESRVDALLAPLFPGGVNGEGVAIGFNVTKGIVEVHLTARAAADRPELSEERAGRALEAVRAALGPYAFGDGTATLEAVVARLLAERGATLALAESCTGGLASARLTRVPGVSAVYRGGVVAYANELKTSALGVPAEVLERHGAVSRECALAMARGVRALANAVVAASITGVAGPDGGTPEKPVGLVYLGLATAGGLEHSRELRLPGDRIFIQRLSALAALDLVRRHLLGLPLG